jgi:putative transposase
MGVRCGRKRIARLMRAAGLVGISHRRKRGRHRPDTATHDDLVKRRFVADTSNRLWCTDITEHPTSEGKVYCAAVMDVYSRQIIGWSIADHIRAELVVDALQMAIWRRHPEPGTIVHADRGAQYTSWVFGHRLRAAGLLGSMGRVASSVDNTMIESFWSTMQRELLDQQSWATRQELSSAIFEWIEAWYNPRRRHTSLGNLSPTRLRNPSQHRRTRGMITTPTPSTEPGQAPSRSNRRTSHSGVGPGLETARHACTEPRPCRVEQASIKPSRNTGAASPLPSGQILRNGTPTTGATRFKSHVRQQRRHTPCQLAPGQLQHLQAAVRRRSHLAWPASR